MKKIIEHGYKYYMETKCPYCGCRFSYEWEDVIGPQYVWTHTGDISGMTLNDNLKIICPECGVEFKILNWTFPNYEGIKITCTCNENGCAVKND